MVMNEAQRKRWNEALAETDFQKRMIRMTVFICENCDEVVQHKVCDYMESQIDQWLESH